MDRVLLLIPTSSYRAPDFMQAASKLGVEVIVGTDRRQALDSLAPGGVLVLDPSHSEKALQRIVSHAAGVEIHAVIGVDDETSVMAAVAAQALGLRHNSPESVGMTRDKLAMRRRLAAMGLHGPEFRSVAVDEDPSLAAGSVAYPCVLKPLFLSASRGVIRADDPRQFVEAFHRIISILDDSDLGARGDAGRLLVESYLDGEEFAVEGLLEDGQLRVLALFDKPDPPRGPGFEETLYVTPSRVAPELQRALLHEVARGCRALGLSEGPVHAELRLDGERPWLIEVAARTIGGLCSRALRFGAGISLEELVLRHALGRETATLQRESQAAGVMMIPIPRAGVLREVRGCERARAVGGIEELTIALHRGAKLVPLPEGNRYLGFTFARGNEAAAVESALREAHAHLDFEID